MRFIYNLAPQEDAIKYICWWKLIGRPQKMFLVENF